MSYNIDAEIIKQLKRDEGFRKDSKGMHVPYRCTAGKLTIGYGHNLDDNPIPGVSESSRLTEEQALRLLDLDIQRVKEKLDRALPWACRLDGPRYGVLVNMAFNLGLGRATRTLSPTDKGTGLLSFERTLQSIEYGKYVEASQSMLLSRWAGQVGGRAVRLSRQMSTGEWS